MEYVFMIFPQAWQQERFLGEHPAAVKRFPAVPGAKPPVSVNKKHPAAFPAAG